MGAPVFQNPQLEGEPFLWAGGPIGVLLVHGFTATTAEVRPLARVLNQAGYTVAGPLLPGHLARPEDVNGTTWRDWARAVEDSYRQLAAHCPRLVVGGESTGALLALYLASEHPEVAAILTYAPALRLKMGWPQRMMLRLAAPFRPYIAKANRHPNPLWQGYTVYPLRGAVELVRLEREVRGRLASIHQPLLVVQGRLDSTVDLRAVETLHRAVGAAINELHWMPDSEHCVILEREREEVYRITLDFLRRVLA